MSELKTCPFCGSPAEIIEDEYHFSGDYRHADKYQARCTDMNCFCDGWWATTKEEAAKIWNTRTPDYTTLAAASRELVEAARVYANRIPKSATRREEEAERFGNALAAVERIIGEGE